MNFFLDDCPHRTRVFQEKYPEAITTSTSKSMIALLKLPVDVMYLFLDHDLAGENVDQFNHEEPDKTIPNTGMEVVAWLEDNPRKIYQIIVHSCNGYAAPVMEARLKKAGYSVVGCPFWILVPQLGK